MTSKNSDAANVKPSLQRHSRMLSNTAASRARVHLRVHLLPTKNGNIDSVMAAKRMVHGKGTHLEVATC